jgi:hypothetical protein
MPSIYDIQQEIKSIFSDYGYTIYDISTFDNKKITRLDGEYPVLCIGRGEEVIDNEGSPTDFLVQDCEIYLNVVLKTSKDDLEKDSAEHLRIIKDIIYTNRRTSSWCNWVISENFTAQLENTNDFSSVFGGIDITTNINYRENQILQKRPQLINVNSEELLIGDQGITV